MELDGQWHFLDCTWAAGYFNAQGEFTRELDDFWWLTPPEIFLNSHFPINTEWLLLPPGVKPPQLSDWEATPHFHTHFFKLGLCPAAGSLQAVELSIAANTTMLEFDVVGTAVPIVVSSLRQWLPDGSLGEPLEVIVLVPPLQISLPSIRLCPQVGRSKTLQRIVEGLGP